MLNLCSAIPRNVIVACLIFLCENFEKAYFEQRLDCAAPKCCLKYTTTPAPNTHHISPGPNQIRLIILVLKGHPPRGSEKELPAALYFGNHFKSANTPISLSVQSFEFMEMSFKSIFVF